MPVNLFEAAVFVAEMAALAVRAEPLTIELAAILGLVLVIHARLLLLVQVKLVILAEFFVAVSILTFAPVAAVSGVYPVLAHFSFVHGPLYEALVSHQLFIEGGFRAVFMIEQLRCRDFDGRDYGAVMRCRHKSLRLLEAHVVEWVHLGWREALLRLRWLLLWREFSQGGRENEG